MNSITDRQCLAPIISVRFPYNVKAAHNVKAKIATVILGESAGVFVFSNVPTSKNVKSVRCKQFREDEETGKAGRLRTRGDVRGLINVLGGVTLKEIKIQKQ